MLSPPVTRETEVLFPDGEASTFLDRETAKSSSCELGLFSVQRVRGTLEDEAASIGGSVVEFSPATREARVRFPANAEWV